MTGIEIAVAIVILIFLGVIEVTLAWIYFEIRDFRLYFMRYYHGQ